ncbi:hypothetical protein V6N13_098670 [Hibiscus sabdariffa]
MAAERTGITVSVQQPTGNTVIVIQMAARNLSSSFLGFFQTFHANRTATCCTINRRHVGNQTGDFLLPGLRVFRHRDCLVEVELLSEKRDRYRGVVGHRDSVVEVELVSGVRDWYTTIVAWKEKVEHC